MDIEINNQLDWKKKHWRSICQNYGKAAYFSRYSEQLEHIFSNQWLKLIDLNNAVTELMQQDLELECKIVYSSEMECLAKGSQLVLDLCLKNKATHYLSGPFGRDYLDESTFIKHGIQIEYHDYEHPKYGQVYQGFEPYMSMLDLLLNYGSNSLQML